MTIQVKTRLIDYVMQYEKSLHAYKAFLKIIYLSN